MANKLVAIQTGFPGMKRHSSERFGSPLSEALSSLLCHELQIPNNLLLRDCHFSALVFAWNSLVSLAAGKEMNQVEAD